VSRVLTILAVVITLVYPLAVWLGEGRVEPRLLGGLLLLAVLTRLPTLTVSHAARWWLGGTMLLLILVIWANVSLPLKLYPVVVNGALLVIFAHSLIVPPTVVDVNVFATQLVIWLIPAPPCAWPADTVPGTMVTDHRRMNPPRIVRRARLPDFMTLLNV